MSLAPFEVDLDAILALPDGPEREGALRVAAVIKDGGRGAARREALRRMRKKRHA